MDNCIFCKIAKGKIPAKKVYEDDDVFAFWDINPQAPKHFLVIPKRHLAGPVDFAPENETLVGKLMRVAAEQAQANGLASYRLVMNNGAGAGQTVFHAHLHVLGGRSLGWPPG